MNARNEFAQVSSHIRSSAWRIVVAIVAAAACLAASSLGDATHTALAACVPPVAPANFDGDIAPWGTGSAGIDNGTGVPGVGGVCTEDNTVPMSDLLPDAADGDTDNDGLPDAGGVETCVNLAVGSPFATFANADNLDLMTVAGDPTSWDSDGDAIRDGAECVLNTNPLLKSSKPTAAACANLTTGGIGPNTATTDVDGDGLTATAENCKWGTSDTNIDSDGDGLKDCVEANDTNGDGLQTFFDYINSAKAANNIIQKTSDFDLNGDGAMNFPGDSILSAKMVFHVGGIC